MKKNVLQVAIIVLLVILIAMVLGFGVYYIADNKNNNGISNDNNANSSNSDILEENLSLDSSIVKTLSNKVIGVYTGVMFEYEDYFYKNNKTILANENLNFKLSLSAQSIVNSFMYDESSYNCNQGVCGISYISEQALKDAYYQLFGKNSNYQRGSFDVINCASKYSYSSTNNRYEAIVSDGCGGAQCGGSISKLYQAKKINQNGTNRIELIEVVAFVVCNDDYYEYYKDINHKELVEKVLYNQDNKEVLEKFPEKYSQYKYTFIEDDEGIYVFTSVEKIK